jgi:multidrug efflux system membrane fusion protein
MTPMHSSRPDDHRSTGRILVGVSAFLLLCACENGGQAAPAAAKAGPKTPPPVPVKVAVVEQRAVALRLDAIGTVAPIRSVSIRPRVGGEIIAVGFKKGDDVKTGDVLFQLDPRPFQVALAQAEAQLKRDQVLAANAQVEARRYHTLVEGDFIGSQPYDVARGNAAALNASLAVDQVAIDAAKLNLDYATIKSPIDGRTGDVLVDIGNLASPTSAEPLVLINQLQPIDAAFAVPEESLAEIRARRAAGTLVVEARPPPDGTLEEGTLSFIDNTVDTATGMIELKATFPNEDGVLWPGQYVDVTLVLGERADAIVAPAAAVQTGQQGRFVFVVKADGTAEMRPIELVTIDDREAVIATGLSAGETVVTDGQFRLVPGSRVKVPGADGGQPPGSPAGAGTPPAPPR